MTELCAAGAAELEQTLAVDNMFARRLIAISLAAVAAGLSVSGLAYGTQTATPAAAVIVHNVPGAATLSGIACASARACIAVGYSGAGGAVVPVSGGVPGAAVRAGRKGTTLAAASCSGAGSCEAVGEAHDESGVAVADTERSVGSVRRLTGNYSALGAVACADATRCVAVGANAGVVVAITNAVPGPVLPARHMALFNDVACASSSVCEAVGTTPSRGRAVRIVKGAPTSREASAPDDMDPASIACPGGGGCVVVGGYFVPHAHEGTVDSLGKHGFGAVHSVPATAFLSSVSCATSTTCLAVGNTGGTPERGLLVPIVNGVPQAPRELPDVFTAIACPSAHVCYAVGSDVNPPYDGFVATIPVDA
jgi:hypothetical protein